jgi:hypothetical protein
MFRRLVSSFRRKINIPRPKLTWFYEIAQEYRRQAPRVAVIIATLGARPEPQLRPDHRPYPTSVSLGS